MRKRGKVITGGVSAALVAAAVAAVALRTGDKPDTPAPEKPRHVIKHERAVVTRPKVRLTDDSRTSDVRRPGVQLPASSHRVSRPAVASIPSARLGKAELSALDVPEPVGRTARELPFYVGCSTYTEVLERTVERERQMQLSVHGSVRVIRFADNSNNEAAGEMLEASDRPVIAVCMFDALPDALYDRASLPKVAAIVLGHAASADYSEADYQAVCEKLDQHRRALQNVTDAPVLLAVSWVNAHDADPTRVMAISTAWTAAQPHLDRWDGYAIYNINGFAFFEFNDLTTVRQRLNLPDKPTLLFELIGTLREDARSKEIWRRKSIGLGPKLMRQGWAGVILYSRGDVGVKAAATDWMWRATR